MYVQVMTFEEAEKWEFNPFDLTKVWPHGEFPLRQVGKLTFNRNPKNYFAEVEQLAFSPSHLVPGIEPSPDKMLQGRLFSYNDAHRHRLGTNYLQIPVNCPYRSKAMSYQRDGPQTVTTNFEGAPNYFPNSFGGPRSDRQYLEHAKNASPSADVGRFNSADEDNFRLVDNIASHIIGAQEFLQERAVKQFGCADPEYGRMLRERINYYKNDKAMTNGQPMAMVPMTAKSHI